MSCTSARMEMATTTALVRNTTVPGHEDQDDVTDCISQHTPQLLGGNAYGKQPISTRQNNKRLKDIFVLNYNVCIFTTVLLGFVYSKH